MKRSKALSLLLMGSLTVGAAGCGEEKVEEGMYTFTSIEECVQSQLFAEEECLDLARTAFAQTPRFSSQQECEEQFGEGACREPKAQNDDGTTVRRSGSMWIPMMMGFMAGRFMGNGGMMQGSQGLYRDTAAQQQGNTSTTTRSFRTAGGETVKPDAKGRVTNPTPRMTQAVSHQAKPVQSRSSFKSRGGFSGGKSFGGGGS